MYRYIITHAQLERLRSIVGENIEFIDLLEESLRILDSLPLIRGGYNTTQIQPRKNEWPIDVVSKHISSGQFPTHDELISDLKLALMKLLEDWWPHVYDRTCRSTVKSQAGWIRELIERRPYHMKDVSGQPITYTLTAEMVKQLREKTGEGLMACKKALVSCKGDMAQAEEYLRNMGNIGAELRALPVTAPPKIKHHINAAEFMAKATPIQLPAVELAKEFMPWYLPAGVARARESQQLVVVCTGEGKSYLGDSIFEDFSPWILCNLRLPTDHTPVLIKYKGKVRVGELGWDAGSVEENYKPYRYWDCPYNDGQDWEWDDVTHWMPLP